MIGTRLCKVCGRKYEYCKTVRPADIFRWQDVACSPEHAAIYFARIAESRATPMAENDDAPLSELDGIGFNEEDQPEGTVESDATEE